MRPAPSLPSTTAAQGPTKPLPIIGEPGASLPSGRRMVCCCAKETCGPFIGEGTSRSLRKGGRRCTAFCFYRVRKKGREEERHIRKRGTFPLMHQIYCSFISRACARVRGMLTPERRIPGRWQGLLKKHAKPDGSTGVCKTCQRVLR